MTEGVDLLSPQRTGLPRRRRDRPNSFHSLSHWGDDFSALKFLGNGEDCFVLLQICGEAL